MFNSSSRDGSVDETLSPIAISAVAPASFESDMNYFDVCSDWNLYDAENIQCAQSFTSSPVQGRDFFGLNPESPTSSSEGAIASSLLRKGSFPGQEEKVSRCVLSVSKFVSLTERFLPIEKSSEPQLAKSVQEATSKLHHYPRVRT